MKRERRKNEMYETPRSYMCKILGYLCSTLILLLYLNETVLLGQEDAKLETIKNQLKTIITTEYSYEKLMPAIIAEVFSTLQNQPQEILTFMNLQAYLDNQQGFFEVQPTSPIANIVKDEKERLERAFSSKIKTTEDILSEVRKSVPFYSRGDKITIPTRFGKIEGVLMAVGSGKIQVGSRYLSTIDFPEETQASFYKTVHEAYIRKKANIEINKEQIKFQALVTKELTTNIPSLLLKNGYLPAYVDEAFDFSSCKQNMWCSRRDLIEQLYREKVCALIVQTFDTAGYIFTIDHGWMTKAAYNELVQQHKEKPEKNFVEEPEKNYVYNKDYGGWMTTERFNQIKADHDETGKKLQEKLAARKRVGNGGCSQGYYDPLPPRDREKEGFYRSMYDTIYEPPKNNFIPVGAMKGVDPRRYLHPRQ